MTNQNDDGTPHHYVISVTITGPHGGPIGGMSREGIVHWRPGETRQDQYRKALNLVSSALQADGLTHGFVTQFWSLNPNQL